MSFSRFIRELCSTLTIIAILLFLLLAMRVAVINPRLAFALVVVIALYVFLSLLGALLRKLRGSISR